MSPPSLTFLSVFLSLTTGVHPVEVQVVGPVDAIEIALDDRVVAELTAPPWRTSVDFGDALRPHRLHARALDENGAVLSEIMQTVNLPRTRAECSLNLEPSPQNPEVLAIRCIDFLSRTPDRLTVTLDGTVVDTAHHQRIKLPALDLRQFHLINVHASFPDQVECTAQLRFGGGFGGQIQTELTAVPVFFDARRKLKMKDVAGLFEVDGRPVRVSALEQSPPRIMIVEDESARLHLINSHFGFNNRSAPSAQRQSTSDARIDIHESRIKKLAGPDGNDWSLQFLDPFTIDPEDTERDIQLFPVSQRFRFVSWGLRHLLLNTHLWSADGEPLRYTHSALKRGGSQPTLP